MKGLSPLNQQIIDILIAYDATVDGTDILIPDVLCQDLGIPSKISLNELNMMDGFVQSLIAMLQTDGRYSCGYLRDFDKKGLLLRLMVNVDTTVKKEQYLQTLFTSDGEKFEHLADDNYHHFEQSTTWQDSTVKVSREALHHSLMRDFQNTHFQLIKANTKAYQDAYWKLLDGSVGNDESVNLDEELQALEERFQIAISFHLIQLFNCI